MIQKETEMTNKKPNSKKKTKPLKGAKRCINLIVLDKSGSMDSMRREAVDAFNEQIEEIKKHNDKIPTKICLVTFSSTVDDPVFWNVDVDKIEKLTIEKYVPNGMTAMRDAVSYGIKRINELPESSKEDTAILVQVISDGMENNSKNTSASDLSELVQSCQKTNRWTITYLGANQDLSKVSAQTSIHAGSTLAFSATASGMKRASGINSQALNCFYSKLSCSTEMSVSEFYKDIESSDKKDSSGT